MSNHDKQPTLDRMGDYIAAASTNQVPPAKLLGRHRPAREDHRDEDEVVYAVRDGEKTRTVTMSSNANGGRKIRWSDSSGGYIYSATHNFGTQGLMMLLVRGSEVVYEPEESERAKYQALGAAAIEGADGWFISAVADDVSTIQGINALSDWRDARDSVMNQLYYVHFGNLTPARALTIDDARAGLNVQLAEGARIRVGEVLGQVAAFAGMQPPEEWLADTSRPA